LNIEILLFIEVSVPLLSVTAPNPGCTIRPTARISAGMTAGASSLYLHAATESA
jgi:hypothetical protein